MKSIIVFMASALATQAALVEFDLSPPGTDAADGLSPLNEVPAATNSTGSGGELVGDGIVYDTDTGMLSLAIGYGSALQFENLTGAAIAAHIHGPAPVGSNATVIVSLANLHFVSFTGATNGGVIQGVVMVPGGLEQDLLDGLWYVNIHTEAYPGGEIRGQLIAANSAPALDCGEDVTDECGAVTRTEVGVSDADGDDVTVEWHVNGVLMETRVVPGDAALAGTNVLFEAVYPVGTNLVEFVTTDAIGRSDSCSITVTISDTTAPVIRRLAANPATLWPPNHKMVPVTVRAQIDEECGEVRWGILRVTSNEPINGPGDGNTDPDWRIVDHDTVELRAERSGNLTGRVYTIWVGARDEAGNVAEPKSVEVVVPHDQGNSNPPPKAKSYRQSFF